MKEIFLLNSLINNSKKITVITGAGVSTGSGLTDFKTLEKKEGNLEEILSVKTLNTEPEKVLEFIKKYFPTEFVKPNFVHKYLSELQERKPVTIITTNIDRLQNQDEHRNVIELHGNAENWQCSCCKMQYSINDIIKRDLEMCKSCCASLVPTNLVLNGGHVPQQVFMRATDEIRNSDLLIVVGTRIKTNDLNYLVSQFKHDNSVLINNEVVKCDCNFKLNIIGDIKDTFYKLSQLNKNKEM